MADPFQPKFVDLVRNFTTTTGTGNFTLAQPVSGFTGFTAACAVGDSFYYSAIGIDKPNEREVGRGTLLDDGTISRDPISGTKTNFTSGTKAIALIAAAEWFEAAQDLVAGVTPVGQALITSADAVGARAALGLGAAALEAVSRFAAAVADRSALAAFSAGSTAYLREAGREGIFSWAATNLSAEVTADSAQGMYVAPPSDPSGASGAWVRKVDGPFNPAWWGVIEGDDSAKAGANTAAWEAMVSCLCALSCNYPNATSRSLGHVRFAPGVYWFANNGGGAAIEINRGNMVIEGAGGGWGGGRPTTLKVSHGYHCIRVQNDLTSGDSGTGTGSSPASGGGTAIRNLVIEGGYSNAEGEYHGIFARTVVSVENVAVRSMSGDGVRIASDLTNAVADECLFKHVHTSRCRNGFYLDGSNANACTTLMCKGILNRQWDLWDSSFLGNCHVGFQASSLGSSTGGSPPSGVTYSGGHYAVIDAQETGASTNAPSGTGIDNAWWLYVGSGTTSGDYPDWVSGTTYRAGGSYCTDNINQKNMVFVGCYDESSGARSQIVSPALIIGGFLSISPWKGTPSSWGPAPSLKANSGGALDLPCGIKVTSGTVTSWWGSQGSNNSSSFVSVFSEPTAAPSGYYLLCRTDVADIRFTYNKSTTYSQMPYIITGPNTTQQYGTGASAPHRFYAPLLVIPPASSAQSSARRLMIDAAAPTTTVHAQGDWVLDRAGASGLIGRKCTVAGTPGTWVDMWSGYGISQIGYATGAGGAVAQATSKSTGVTLNKLCGQITMNAAALAAAAIVEFTVTNSQVAATDTINLNLASGAATSSAYRYWISGVAAGSFKVCVENRSAASLSEALALSFTILKSVTA